MKLDFETVLKIVQGATQIVPAFTELFEHVVAAFGEDDQDKLKAAYADARARSDALHVSTQEKLKDATGR
jgi:hypothetical protein